MSPSGRAATAVIALLLLIKGLRERYVCHGAEKLFGDPARPRSSYSRVYGMSFRTTSSSHASATLPTQCSSFRRTKRPLGLLAVPRQTLFFQIADKLRVPGSSQAPKHASDCKPGTRCL